MKIYERILPVASETISLMIQNFASRDNAWYNSYNEGGYQLAIEDLMEIEIHEEYLKYTEEPGLEFSMWKESFAFGTSAPEQYLNMREIVHNYMKYMEDEAYIEKAAKVF